MVRTDKFNYHAMSDLAEERKFSYPEKVIVSSQIGTLAHYLSRQEQPTNISNLNILEPHDGVLALATCSLDACIHYH